MWFTCAAAVVLSICNFNMDIVRVFHGKRVGKTKQLSTEGNLYAYQIHVQSNFCPVVSLLPQAVVDASDLDTKSGFSMGHCIGGGGDIISPPLNV